MANQESQLDEALSGLKTIVTEGFESIGSSVSSAADRVIRALQESDVDLSDEIDALNEMKEAVESQVSETTAKLGQIAPGPIDTEPVHETASKGEPTTDPAPETTQPTSDTDKTPSSDNVPEPPATSDDTGEGGF